MNAQKTTEARYYVDDEGRRWVGKAELYTAFQPVLAEALCWFIGRESKVTAPDAGYVGSIKNNDFIWLSEYVAKTQHWDPRFGNFITNDDDVGAMLALDAVTLNSDRHPHNVLVVAERSETRLRVYAIDSGNALVGQIEGFCSKTINDIPDTTRIITGLPIPRLRVGAASAATRMVDLANHPSFLGCYVDTACDLVGETVLRAPLLEQLRARMQNAHVLASSYLDALEARS